MKTKNAYKGFTLLEVIISAALFSVVSLAILTTMMQIQSHQEVGSSIAEARAQAIKGIERMGDLLWASGISSQAEITYPYVENTGAVSTEYVIEDDMPAENSRLVYRILHDTDGDMIFTDASGNVQWSADVFSLEWDAGRGVGRVVCKRQAAGADPVIIETICTNVKALKFETINEDPVLKTGQIRVTMWIEVNGPTTGPVREKVDTIVNMRNTYIE